MKYFLMLFLAACISCNPSASKKDDGSNTASAAPEDPLTLQLRAAVTTIEKNELEQAGTLKAMTIDSLQHQMISLQDFYTIKKQGLVKNMAASSNKEKTAKALDYLDQMIARSPADKSVYAVTFHLMALLPNNIYYNERHTKYLKEDFTEIKVIFP